MPKRCSLDGCKKKSKKNGFCIYHQFKASPRPQKSSSPTWENELNNSRKFVPYDEYIHSDEWIKKSALARKRNSRCSLCNREYKLTTHHRTYKNLGYEEQNDLTVLCENCHYIFHKFYTYSSKEGCFVPIKENAILFTDTKYTHVLRHEKENTRVF